MGCQPCVMAKPPHLIAPGTAMEAYHDDAYGGPPMDDLMLEDNESIMSMNEGDPGIDGRRCEDDNQTLNTGKGLVYKKSPFDRAHDGNSSGTKDPSWIAYVDEKSSAVYYLNTKTGETTWEKPKLDSCAIDKNDFDRFESMESLVTCSLPSIPENLGESSGALPEVLEEGSREPSSSLAPMSHVSKVQEHGQPARSHAECETTTSVTSKKINKSIRATDTFSASTHSTSESPITVGDKVLSISQQSRNCLESGTFEKDIAVGTRNISSPSRQKYSNASPEELARRDKELSRRDSEASKITVGMIDQALNMLE